MVILATASGDPSVWLPIWISLASAAVAGGSLRVGYLGYRLARRERDARLARERRGLVVLEASGMQLPGQLPYHLSIRVGNSSDRLIEIFRAHLLIDGREFESSQTSKAPVVLPPQRTRQLMFSFYAAGISAMALRVQHGDGSFSNWPVVTLRR